MFRDRTEHFSQWQLRGVTYSKLAGTAGFYMVAYHNRLWIHFRAFLEKMPYQSFIKTTSMRSAVDLSSLIPTMDALDEHIRMYLQTQEWFGNSNVCPSDWVSCLEERSLWPIKRKLPPAPEELLKFIFCTSKKKDGITWSFRKVGLFCNIAYSVVVRVVNYCARLGTRGRVLKDVVELVTECWNAGQV